MKKSDLKNLIKGIIIEQRAKLGGQNSFSQTIPLDMSEQDAQELEQIFMREYPGGVIDLGGTEKKIKITFRFKLKWPPEFVLTITW